MRDPSIKTPISWEEFRELVLKDEATRDFTEKKPTVEKKEKPKKVEKAKTKEIAPVQPKEEEIMPKPVEPEEGQQAEKPEESQEGQQAKEQTGEQTEKQPEAAGAKYEDTDVLDKIQVDLIDELEIIKTYIERRNWKSAKETAEDVVNRIKHLGY
jgi:outer membrane biosynthesis protein TonB